MARVLLMTTTQIAMALPPLFTTPDTYTGHWTREGIPAHLGAASHLARDIAATATTGIIWESAGHMASGRELFCRSRYIATSDGSLHMYTSSGRKVIVHPADRPVRILVTR